MRVGNKVFAFAQSHEEAGRKMQKFRDAPADIEKHLLVVGAPAQVHSVCTMAEAMRLIADHISQTVDRKQQ